MLINLSLLLGSKLFDRPSKLNRRVVDVDNNIMKNICENPKLCHEVIVRLPCIVAMSAYRAFNCNIPRSQVQSNKKNPLILSRVCTILMASFYMGEPVLKFMCSNGVYLCPANKTDDDDDDTTNYGVAISFLGESCRMT